MDNETTQHLTQLLAVHKARHRALEIKQAHFGKHADVALLNEIQDLERIIQETAAQLEEAERKDTLAVQGDNLAFQNQQEALGLIDRQTHIGTIVINAPAGYGKTYLIQQVTKKRQAENWYVHQVVFKRHYPDTLPEHEVLSEIMQSVGVRYTHEPELMGRMLANKLREISNASATPAPQGAYLIIDGAEKMYSDTSNRSYTTLSIFFHSLIEEKAAFEQFQLKIILSGRYIVDERLMIFHGKPTTIDLKVFNLDVVQAAVYAFFSARQMAKSPDWNARVAANVLYITGGHPRMIRDLLKSEADSILSTRPEDWLARNHQHLFERIIDPALRDIQKDQPQHGDLWDELLQLSVFREFDRSIIRAIFPEKNHLKYTDRLERYGLVSRHRSIFRDGVLRPAMLRWLQFGELDRARNYCRKAKDILQQQLSRATLIEQMPPILTEMFHLCLLEAHDILLQRDSTRRMEHHQAIEQEMHGYINQALIQSDDDIDEFIDAFKRLLYADTELGFLFDYIFKGQVRLISTQRPDIIEREYLDYGLQIERFVRYCEATGASQSDA